MSNGKMPDLNAPERLQNPAWRYPDHGLAGYSPTMLLATVGLYLYFKRKGWI